jgi:hypothetical protein
MPTGEAGSRIAAPDGQSRPPVLHKPLTRPDLAHSNRERSTEPLPDTHQTRPPGTPAPGLTWGFVWQVLGSNQRRLSRRFYRPLRLRAIYGPCLRRPPQGRLGTTIDPTYIPCAQ